MQAAEQTRVRSEVKGDVVKQLLPLVDSFELARGQLQPQTDGEVKIDSAYQVRCCRSVPVCLPHYPATFNMALVCTSHKGASSCCITNCIGQRLTVS